MTRSASLPATAVGLDAQSVVLSADGDYVAYQSSSTDLIAGQVDNNGHVDVFLFDANTETNRLVSGAEGSATVTGNGPSFQSAPIAISAHGRFVAYKSFATNLVVGQNDANNNGDLFLFDGNTATNRLISHAAGNPLIAATGASAASEIPVFNIDRSNNESTGEGLYVAFQSSATNLVTGVTDNGTARDLFLYEVSTGTNTLITHAASPVSAPAATLVPWAVENGSGRTPVLSSDGRFVAYSSPATDLVAGQVDSVLAVTNDVFRYDRTTGANELVSGAGSSTTQTANSAADVNGISADGQIIVFSSDSSDLVGGDNNSRQDVFVREATLQVTYSGLLTDVLSHQERNKADGVIDQFFSISFGGDGQARDIKSLKLVRDDGTTWTSNPTGNELILAVANHILTAAADTRDPDGFQEDSSFFLVAADTTQPRLFTVGDRFTLTATFVDGSSESVEIGPLPPPTLTYEGKRRDRVGRGEAAVSGDGQKDGTFKLKLPPGTGTITSLELDRGDGNRWNTVPNDSFWVLGVSDNLSLDRPLLNNADGSVTPFFGSTVFGDNELFLFAGEDRPEAPSFFTIGKTFRAIVRLDGGTTMEATVTLTADNIPPPQPDLAVTLTHNPEPVHAFQEIVYTATVQNQGDAAATHVQLRTGPLPDGVEFISDNSPANCEQLSKRIVCTLDTIEPGSGKTVKIPLKTNNKGVDFTIKVSGSATEPDQNTLDDAASSATTVLEDLQLTLSDSADPIRAGEEITYTIQLHNPNSTPESDVRILNRIPENTTFVSVSTSLCSLQNEFVTCDISQLDPGQTLPLKFVVRAPQTADIENLGAAALQAGVLIGASQREITTVRPANDDFADRQKVTGKQGSVPGSNINATGEALNVVGVNEEFDPAQTPKSVWYEWTPSYASGNYGSVTISTAGSNFDTLLSVFTRLSNGQLRRVTINDDVDPSGNDRTSRVEFNAIGGLTHYIAVDGYHGAEGTLTLTWSEGPEFVPSPHNQVITHVAPPQVDAGTGAEFVVVHGLGFTAEPWGLSTANGDRPPSFWMAMKLPWQLS